MNNKSHYDLVIQQKAEGKRSIVVRYRLGEMMHIAKEVTIPKGKIYLQLKGDNDFYYFEWSADGKEFEALAKMDVIYLSTETAGGFTGIYLGLFACSAISSSKAFADFDNFLYMPKLK